MATGMMVITSAAMASFQLMVYCPKNLAVEMGIVLFAVDFKVSEGSR